MAVEENKKSDLEQILEGVRVIMTQNQAMHQEISQLKAEVASLKQQLGLTKQEEPVIESSAARQFK